MNKLRLTATLCVCLFATAAAANELVKFPNGPAAWTIEASPSPDSNKKKTSPSSPVATTVKTTPAVTIVKVEVMQDTDKNHSVMQLSNNKTREMWSLTGLDQTLTEDPNGTIFFSHEPIPFSPSAFDWIKPGHLREKEPIQYHDKKCFHYLANVPVLSPFGEPLGTIKIEAWIDSATLMPVALDDGSELGIFNFQQSPPAEPLTIPAKFNRALENKKRVMGLH